MVIEVLYVPGCPNHQAAIDTLKNVLGAASISAPIREMAIKDEAMARELKFPGSPTVRINGRDVESNPEESYGLACRLYSNGSGVPSLETLQRAVLEHEERRLKYGFK
jgi:hypothetical protein